MATKWHPVASALPAHQIEPYALWFEFLQLASKDPTVTIDKALYKAWEPYEDLGFLEWGPRHWRELFAVSVGVRTLAPGEEIQRADSELIVSIPLHQDKGRSVSQIKRLLDDNGAGTQLKKMPKGQFFLNVGEGADGRPIHPSTRFLKTLPKVRLYMYLYRFWLKHPDLADDKRLEAMSKDYFAWTDPWNRNPKVHWKARRELPTALVDYVRYLEKRGDRHRLPLDKYNEPDNGRRQVARYLRKARKIAANVGQGIFPGSYD
jgi:hypothetical protein